MPRQNINDKKPILNVNIRVFVYIGLVFLLFYPPFLRGLFFPPELLMTHMYTAVLFALCWYDKILRRDVTFLKGPLDYLTFAFIFVYVFSLFDAVNMRGAVGELLKVINYFMVYWITKEFVKSEKDIKAIYRAIYFSAVGVAVVGIGAAMGVIDYPGAIVYNRIFSTLQYPNTTAAFLALATFLGLILLNQSQNRFGKAVYSTGNMLLMTVLVASQSRGSWMLYPLVVVLFFVGLPKHYRFSVFYNFVIALGVGLQVARVLLPRMIAGSGLTSWKYIVLGAAVVIAAQWAFDLVIDWLDRRDVREGTRKLIGIGVVVYAFVVLLFYVAYTVQAVPSVAAKFAPSDSLQRAETINKQDASFVFRFDLTKTAFKMSMDYPLNGLGGGGWNDLYHRYQSYLMYSSETHNYPAKVLVETGYIGLLVLIGIWIAWGNKLYLLWRARPERDTWALFWAGGVAALTLVIHSIYDFDLSMGAMAIVLWSLWGLTRGCQGILVPNQKPVVVPKRKVLIAVVAATLGAALLFIPGASFYAAGMAGAEGAAAMTKKNWDLAEARLSKAVRLDPFTASYAADLAQVCTIKGLASNDRSLIALGENFAKQAVRREPYNYQMRLRLLAMSILLGRVEQAVQDAESLVANNPLDVHNFEILGKTYIFAGRYLYESGNKEKARNYWAKTQGLEKQLNEKIRELDIDLAGVEGDPLQVTPVVNLFVGEGEYLLGNYSKASILLDKVNREQMSLPEPLQVETELYLNAIKVKEGQKANAQQEITRLAKTFPGLPAEFKRLLQIAP